MLANSHTQRRTPALALLVLFLVVAFAKPASAAAAYVLTQSKIGIIETGPAGSTEGTLLSPLVPITGINGSPVALARNPANGQIVLSASAFGEIIQSNLAFLDPATGVATPIVTVSDHDFSDLAFTPDGRLFGFSSSCDLGTPFRLFEINLASGAVTPRASASVTPGFCYGSAYGALAFNPADGMLYMSYFGDDQVTFLDRVDPATFLVTRVLEGAPLENFFPTSFSFNADGTAFAVENSARWDLSLTSGVSGIGFIFYDSNVVGPVYVNVDAVLPVTTGCVPSRTAVCLGQGRFRVEASYDAPGFGSGPGGALLESQDSAKFWFFDSSNVEMVLKVLNACGVNGQYWVLAGGLTNVGVTMRVTDTKTGKFREYTNPQGTQFAPIADTAALDVCP